jgi:CspA family cold shock protein
LVFVSFFIFFVLAFAWPARRYAWNRCVEWFNSEKGYGFIMREAYRKFLFCLFNIQDEGCMAKLENQHLRYAAGPGAKGPQATGIRIL